MSGGSTLGTLAPLPAPLTLWRFMSDVFIDLDGTLIYSRRLPRGAASARHPFVVSPEGIHYSVHLRPTAPAILSQLRSVARVRLLTASTVLYATSVNSALSLGFARKDIHSILETPSGWSCRRRSRASAPFLIDDAELDDLFLALKLKWLGVTADRLICVPRWLGRHDLLQDRLPVLFSAVHKMLT